MNVLVYAGTDAVQVQTARTVTLLKSVLRSRYAVQTVSSAALANHPWFSGCALLVVPAIRDLPVSEPITRSIETFVNNGGALLALSSGLHRLTSAPSQSTLALRLRSSGDYLSLVPSPHQEDASADVGQLQLTSGGIVDKISLSSSSLVEEEIAVNTSDIQPLANVSLPDKNTTVVAGAVTRALGGPIAVWTLSVDALKEQEASHRLLLATTLAELGLSVPVTPSTAPTRPGPLALVSSPEKPHIVARIEHALALFVQQTSQGSPLRILEDEHDTFHFLDTSGGLLRPEPEERWNPETRDPREILVFRDGALPKEEETLFELRAYFSALAAARGKRTSEPWGVGEALLYGAAVTSTQTLLDRNPTFLSALPSPLVALASFQLAGRGRGANAWLSPAGCLQFSLLLRVRLSQLPAARLVFVQYLFALAVAEAVRAQSVLGDLGNAVRLKWPNDVYLVKGGQTKKIGGILVNTSFRQGEVDIIIGSGLNVSTEAPLSSLTELLPPEKRDALKTETIAAEILAAFERLWSEFLEERGSFAPFNDLYLERWLHSDQPVTVTTVNPPRKVRIVGITPNHGLLRTMPERLEGGKVEYIDLQPNGNSFDLMAGLIKTKGS